MKQRKNPINLRKIEREYARLLRRVADQVGLMIGAFKSLDYQSSLKIIDSLQKYAELLTDWATVTATNILTQVEKKDKAAWMEYSKELSKGLQEEIKNAPTGKVMKELLDEQVTLIKSIPLAAAQRVHDLAIEATEGGKRASEVAELIKQSTQVSVSKANTIARTEVSRASSVLTQARAMHIGSEGYIWRTTGDSDVRESHKKMNGKFVKWTEPPALLEGKKIYHAHAGQIFNCRCYPEPVLPE